jgi:hypothetical protein
MPIPWKSWFITFKIWICVENSWCDLFWPHTLPHLFGCIFQFHQIFPCLMSHPYFDQVWGWSPTLGKVGSWSPPGLPNVQRSIARPKTPRLGVFLVSLKRSRSVDVQNGLALVIWTFAAQVMGKRRVGSQTGNLAPDH